MMQQIKDINISLKMNQIGFEVKNIFSNDKTKTDNLLNKNRESISFYKNKLTK